MKKRRKIRYTAAEKKRIKVLRLGFIVIIILAIACFVLVGSDILKNTETKPVIAPTEQTTTQPETEPSPQPTEQPQDQTVNLIAVGDNLFHQSLIDDGSTKADYLGYYSPVSAFIADADIAFVNQETVIGGNELGLTGYPNFNTPTEVGEALVEVGFDVVNHATNHLYDKGMAGIDGTLEFWKNYPEILVTGIYDTQQARDEISLIEEKGINFAFLAYTYGLNGYSLPAGEGHSTNLLDLALMEKDILKAKEVSDVVVVSLHWGTEYSLTPTATQKEIANKLNSLGVDIILGHHPHVIQPVEKIVGADGFETVVYYSLGNFTHSQETINPMLGVAANIEITKDSNGDVSVTNSEAIPLINHYEVGKKGFKVYKLQDYTKELADAHGIKAFDKAMDIDYMTNLSKQVLGDWYKQ